MGTREHLAQHGSRSCKSGPVRGLWVGGEPKSRPPPRGCLKHSCLGLAELTAPSSHCPPCCSSLLPLRKVPNLLPPPTQPSHVAESCQICRSPELFPNPSLLSTSVPANLAQAPVSPRQNCNGPSLTSSPLPPCQLSFPSSLDALLKMQIGFSLFPVETLQWFLGKACHSFLVLFPSFTFSFFPVQPDPHELRKKESEVAQSCPTLCDPMDCSLPGSSIHGIFQTLEYITSSQKPSLIYAIWDILVPPPSKNSSSFSQLRCHFPREILA